MSQELISRLRKDREGSVVAAGFKFTFRRPTDAEFIAATRSTGDVEKVADFDFIRRFIVGWQRDDGSPVLADHIDGHGGQETVAFEPALFAEWIADRGEMWAPLSRAILDAYLARSTIVKDAEKK